MVVFDSSQMKQNIILIDTFIERRLQTSGAMAVLDDNCVTWSSVSEAAADYDFADSFEYKRAKGSQYIYDANGSLVADKSRGIVYITYDANNNPRRIYFANGNETRFVYSASGQKLRVTHNTAKPNITRTFGVEPAGLTTAQILYPHVPQDHWD